MKKTIIIPAILVATLLTNCGGSGKQNQSENNAGQADSSAAECRNSEENPLESYNLSSDRDFFEGNDKLPQSIDLQQDINNLSYQRLRYLKSYLYALKGVWIKDMDINNFFHDRTTWYQNVVNKRWYPTGNESWNETYWKLWETDYEKALSNEQLSPQEKQFIDNINNRMKELEANKYQKINGLNIGKVALATNAFQFPDTYNPNSKFVNVLNANNVTFQTTNYEQLFNVYENNSYKMIPNFITTDLFLQAFHMYFEYTLKTLETYTYLPILNKFIDKALAPGNYGATNDDEQPYLDFVKAYFQIAKMLIEPNSKLTYQADYESIINQELDNINKQQDNISPLLETQTMFSYSLFKPRGHYTRNQQSQQYFRTMMWLQYASFDSDNDEQIKRAIAIAKVFNEVSDKQDFLNFYHSLDFLIGEPDNVSIISIADFIKKNYPDAILSDLIDTEFPAIKAHIAKLFKSCNKIQPKVQVTTADKINFMPMRYCFDNEVISNMYDEKINSERAYPSGIDVFDALNVKSAQDIQDTLIKTNKQWSEYQKYRKQMADKFNNFDNWDASNYNTWMKILVDMQKIDKDYPDFMKTSAWNAKNLNTALASWAELKHDAILYAEQPMGAECGAGEEFPSPVPTGFVEPNINFWNAISKALDKVYDVAAMTTTTDNDLKTKYNNLKEMIVKCKEISEKEIAHKKIIDEDSWFMYSIGSSMEYFTLSVIDPELYLDNWSNVSGADRSVAVVADVFTRNIRNCEKQGILYEATGTPNMIFALVEINNQLYITCGATFSYYEFVRPMGDRLTDEQWQEMLEKKKAPSQPEWFAPLLLDEIIEAAESHTYSSGC